MHYLYKQSAHDHDYMLDRALPNRSCRMYLIFGSSYILHNDQTPFTLGERTSIPQLKLSSLQTGADA